MKVRNHRKLSWRFYPSENSKLEYKEFRYKAKLMNFLTSNIDGAINAQVSLHESSFGNSGTRRKWFVWYNDKFQGSKIKAELRQLLFRGKKYVFKKTKISKESKKYFAFSDKIVRAMCNIKDKNGLISVNKAKKLVHLFKKRGFKDFTPTSDELDYINGHISYGIDFFYWSDRCNWLRTKTVIEYFSQNDLLK